MRNAMHSERTPKALFSSSAVRSIKGSAIDETRLIKITKAVNTCQHLTVNK